jgi:hypothetical protein
VVFVGIFMFDRLFCIEAFIASKRIEQFFVVLCG